jgi:hypothetical protein
MVDHLQLARILETKLAGRKAINAHDILCIRRVYNIQKDIALCYAQNYASPRYSQAFVDWVVRKHREDGEFFETTKVQFDKVKAPGA